MFNNIIHQISHNQSTAHVKQLNNYTFTLKKPGCKKKSMLCRASVLSSPLRVKGQGGVISSDTPVRHLWYVQPSSSILTSQGWSGDSLAGVGLVRGCGGVSGAELNSCSVLQRVLACLHLKRRRPQTHQPPLVTSFSLAGHLGCGPLADHAAGCEKDQGCQQEKWPDGDCWVVDRNEGAKGKSSHHGDIDASQHDAQAAGAAQGRGGQILVLLLLLGGLLRSRRSRRIFR